MNGINAALAESAVKASAFTRSLFEHDAWTAEQVTDFINTQRNATIATTSERGQPHAAVVIAASIDDRMYFTVAPQSVLARNVAGNDRVALSICDTQHAVMGQGRAERVGRAPDLAELVGRLADASKSGRFTPDGWDGDIYTLDLRRLFAS